MATFYGAMSNEYGESQLSTKFYSSIEDAVFDSEIEYGDILEYGYTFDNGDDLNIVPKCVKRYLVNTIDNYELLGFLDDRGKEMTPENFMVFNRSDEGYENMFTIVSLS